MAIVKMRKLSVIGVEEEKSTLMKEMMDLGIVEVESVSKKLEDEAWSKLVVRDGEEALAAEYDAKVQKADTAIKVLSDFGVYKKAPFSVRRRVPQSDTMRLALNEETYEREAEDLIDLHEKLVEANAAENADRAEIAALTPWKGYDLPLDLTETEMIRVRLGAFPPLTDGDRLAEELEGKGLECQIDVLGKDRNQCYMSICYFKSDEDEVMEILKSHGFVDPGLSGKSGTVAENIAKLEEDISQKSILKEQIEVEIKGKAANQSNIEFYHDMMTVKRDEYRVREKLLKTDRTFTFDGWVPVAAEETLKRLLDGFTCAYELSDPEEGDDVPVKLRNNKLFEPVEFITKMYSLPDSKEVDPTPIFAFFYVMFFGIMFGDIGYGLILSIATALIIKKNHMYEGSALKLMRLLFYSGLSSIFWGAVFGGFFGNLPTVVAQFFFGKTFVMKPLWLDPGQAAMTFLAFSCGCGVVHLFVGMGIKAYKQIKDGEILRAINDNFVWYVIVLGALFWIFGGKVSAGLVLVGKHMTLAGIAAAIVIPIIIEKGIGKAVGVWNIYSGVTGNLSDILSYSRLLGLGLASTSIATVINFLATMGGKTFGGIVLFIVVELIGHVFNFAINALGAFVHSCRLQFVEFFGKFYDGGGREFEPFQKETKYINIVEEGK